MCTLWPSCPPQNAIVPFKELCGLSAVANLKQCILALSPRLTGPDNSPVLLFNLKDEYLTVEAQGLLPEVLKKVVAAYEMVSIPDTNLCCFIVLGGVRLPFEPVHRTRLLFKKKQETGREHAWSLQLELRSYKVTRDCSVQREQSL